MSAAGIKAERYDGKMSKTARDAVIYNFKETKNMRGLIIQIDAGGQGLNLQEAEHVINTTPDWNPCLEAQAVARVWRRGNSKEVNYMRFVLALRRQTHAALHGYRMAAYVLCRPVVSSRNMVVGWPRWCCAAQ